jgi:hypothetical protein
MTMAAALPQLLLPQLLLPQLLLPSVTRLNALAFARALVQCSGTTSMASNANTAFSVFQVCD